MKCRISWLLVSVAVLCSACSGRQAETEYRGSTVTSAETEDTDIVNTENTVSEEDMIPMDRQMGSGQIPKELVRVPEEYFGAASEQGTLEQLVTNAGYGSEDFFIYAMSGTEDFAYAAFTNQIQAMINAPDGIFIEAANENDGNLAYRVQEGNAHDGNAALQYIYNGLIWLWAEGK